MSEEFSMEAEVLKDEVNSLKLQVRNKQKKKVMSESMKDEFFTCDCFHDEHTLRFSYDDSDDYFEEIYCSVFLSDQPFFKRCWNALKYILGYKSPYGHFGNWVLKKEDSKRLRKLLDKFDG